jgi:regulator of cell morphogenesis and NO signaling
MKRINPDEQVGALALKDPRIRKVLEEIGIDTCCGGAKPLRTAAADSGVSMDRLLTAIEESLCSASEHDPVSNRKWQDAPLVELVNHIEEVHHAFLRKYLPRISEKIDKVMNAHAAKHGDMLRTLQRIFTGLREEIEPHLSKEEIVLFPYIRELSQCMDTGKDVPSIHCGSVAHPIRQMVHEHEKAGEALAILRKETGNYMLPGDACPTFTVLYEELQTLEADLHEHIFLENNILFPRVLEMEKEGLRHD